MHKPLQFTFLLFFVLFHPFIVSAQVTTVKDVNHRVDMVPGEENISIVPNPSKGLFKVKWDKEGDIYELRVVNALGKEVTGIEVLDKKEHRFDLTNQPVGLYFLKVIDSTGESLTKLYLQR